MNTFEQTVYRVSWSVGERASQLENTVYYSMKDAERRAAQPDGWYGSNGHIYSQVLTIDKKTKRVLSINEPRDIY